MSQIANLNNKILKGLLEKAAPKIDAFETPKGIDQKSFMDHMADGLSNVNAAQLTADQLSTQLSTGKSENIHETMLAISNAELSFNLMVQVRNKALEAYQEIMRMPI